MREIKRKLQRLGLSDNQTAVYVLLVARGELRVQEIAQLAQLPRSTVYEVLKKLYELGLAEEVVEEHFKKIKPYPIGVMRHGLEEKIEQLQNLSKDIDRVEEALLVSAGASPTTAVRYYKGRPGARQIFWNSLKTTAPLCVYSEWGRGIYVGMKFYERFVDESRSRDIKERVLINPTPHALESIKRYTFPGSPIARTKVEDIRAIADTTMHIKGETLLYDTTFAQVYLKNVQVNGFEIESPAFSQSQKSLFESLWQTATPVVELLT